MSEALAMSAVSSEAKEAQRKAHRDWSKNHPERVRELSALYYQRHPLKVFISKLKRLYSLSFEEWTRMLIEQCGRCAACGRIMLKPCVDHDHRTKKVRALLCSPCNRILGAAKDDPVRVEKLLAYIQSHTEIS